MNCAPSLNVCPGARTTFPLGPSIVTCLVVVQEPSGFFLKASHGNLSITSPPAFGSGIITPKQVLSRHIYIRPQGGVV